MKHTAHTQSAPPTPLALARLMDALADPSGPSLWEGEVASLRRLMRRPQLYSSLYRQLLRAGADAGLECRAWDFLADAAESAEQLDALLAARGWRRPEEVLDPAGRRDVDHAQILCILESRLSRGEGDAEHLALLRRRLLEVVMLEAGWEAEPPELPASSVDAGPEGRPRPPWEPPPPARAQLPTRPANGEALP